MVIVNQATDEALQAIALNMPTLSRRRLGIRYAEAYRRALALMRSAGLITAYAPGEAPRYHKHASPSRVLRLRSGSAKVQGAE